MTLLVDFKALQSAVHCAGLNDVREALHGVFINGNRIASTDGNIMFVHDDVDLAVSEDFYQVIIPAEAIKGFAKLVGKIADKYIILETKDGNWYLRHNSIEYLFNPINVKYPDITRAIPRVLNHVDFTKHEIKLDLDYLSIVNKIRKGLKLKQMPLMSFTDSAVVYTWDKYKNAKVLLMPMKY